MVSRNGWVVYDDASNYILDANDWWVPIPQPAPSPRTCDAGSANTDVDMSSRSSAYPNGATANSGAACCDLCMNAPDCIAWVYQPSVGNCWPLSGWSGSHGGATDRTFGIVSNVTSGSQQNADAVDAYGFFHGLDYFGAMADFVSISGKTIMVPRYASGIWWSRWYDFNNADVLQVRGWGGWGGRWGAAHASWMQHATVWLCGRGVVSHVRYLLSGPPKLLDGVCVPAHCEPWPSR